MYDGSVQIEIRNWNVPVEDRAAPGVDRIVVARSGSSPRTIGTWLN